MNLAAVVAFGIVAYVFGMTGLVSVVAADKKNTIESGLRFTGWIMMVLAAVIVIGILAEIGNNT
jgi:hypothetical protein